MALNSSIVNTARAAGPALAGLVLGWVGPGVCFLLNTFSFGGTYYALWVMRPPPAPPRVPTSGRAHLLEGLAYAGRTAHVRALLALLAVASLCVLQYPTLLPVIAARTLGGGERLYSLLLASAGLGALAGAIRLLLRGGLRGLGKIAAAGAVLLGAGILGLSLARSPAPAAACLAVAGYGFSTQMAGTMTLLQGLAPAGLRGRVMGLFSTLFVGLTPFGALAAGFLARRVGAPLTLGLGAGALLVAAALFWVALPGLRRTVLAQRPTLFRHGELRRAQSAFTMSRFHPWCSNSPSSSNPLRR
ncbi:MAG: MFS transporter [Anaeromyxobacter sp.]